MGGCRRKGDSLPFAFKIRMCLPHLPFGGSGDDIVPFNDGLSISKLLHKPKKLTVRKLGIRFVVNRLD